MRNLALGANFMMSHILHFYHLAALDYVDPSGAGALTKPFVCPTYDHSYYSRVDGIAVYLLGQYVKALEYRRKCHQLGALFSGKMPNASMYTPGCVTTKCPDPDDTDPDSVAGRFTSLLADIKTFIGLPTDYLTSTTGTYCYDVVAVAHAYPEYFFIGNGYERLLAYGVFEGGLDDGNQPDKRLLTRGRKDSTSPFSPAGDRLPMDHTKIGEFVTRSWYDNYGGIPTAIKHPWKGDTLNNPDADSGGYGATYTYAKAPRYDVVGNGDYADYLPYEVGPLARLVVNFDVGDFAADPNAYKGAIVAGTRAGYCTGLLNVAGYTGTPQPYESASAYYTRISGTMPANLTGAELATGDCTLDRHAARVLETYYIAQNIQGWFDDLDPTQPVNVIKKYKWTVGGSRKYLVPRWKAGYGLTEAPRGALGHWCKIGIKQWSSTWNGKLSKYQIITPTAWNISPKDPNGNNGPIEKSITDTYVADTTQPVEIMRVVHSFDCCIACTVHVTTPKDGEVAKVPVRTGV